MIVGGVAGLVGLVLIIAMLSGAFGGGETKAGSGSKEKPVLIDDNPTDGPPEPKPKPPSISGSGKPGKTPDEPAPALTAQILAQADGLYEAAKIKWNDGQRLRKKGETKAYAEALQEAWTAIESMNKGLEPYTDWYELADLGGWAMPAEYVALAKRFDKYSKLEAKIQKLKTR